MDADTDFESIENEYKALTSKLASLDKDHNRVTAAAEERKRTLRADLEECRKAGLNPDTLPQDLARMKEVIATKIGVFGADLEEYEKQLRPLVAEIERG